MIIATENSVYLLEKDGSEKKPILLHDNLEVRRVRARTSAKTMGIRGYTSLMASTIGMVEE